MPQGITGLLRASPAETGNLNLLCFLVFGVLFAEGAVFGDGQPVGVVALILVAVVISALAFCAFERNFSSC